jgi:hypothetical protein
LLDVIVRKALHTSFVAGFVMLHEFGNLLLIARWFASHRDNDFAKPKTTLFGAKFTPGLCFCKSGILSRPW